MNPRVKIFSIFVALLLLAVVRRLSAQDQTSESVCPLSKDQTQKSIRAFAALAPVFSVDRCVNCHGGVDPFAEDGGHEGDQQKIIRAADGSFDVEQTFATCSKAGCHEELPGWRIAPEGMSFVNKTPVELCKQMRANFGRAAGLDSFMEHMKHDNGDTQFIEAAFKGNKAIKGQIVEKPPGWTQEKMVQLSQAWVDAMGGRFHGDANCGCSEQNYDLELDYEINISLNGLPAIGGQYNTRNLSALEVPLTATAPGHFEGQAVMTLEGHGVINSGVGTCTGQSSQSFLVRATGDIEEGDEASQGQQNKLHVKMDCGQVQHQDSASCPQAGGGSSGFSPCSANVDVDFNPANIDTNNTKDFPVPFPNSKATLTTTITKAE